MDRTVKILVTIFVVVGIALLAYHWINKWHTHTLEQSLQQEKDIHLERIAELEEEIKKLSEEVLTQNPAVLTQSEMTDVFGDSKPESTDCKKITTQVAAFFQYLDSKSYLIWPGSSLRAEELFEELYTKVAARPPINVGEMENLSGLRRNVTHFYRVLGRDRLELLKTIMQSESAVIEPAMAVMHIWLAVCADQSASDGDRRHLREIYPYAAYFLNTLGGRSYLLRRDSKVRMLVNYYAVLTVDMANDNNYNAYGLDIRPYIDYLFYDINNQKGLMYRERYLTQLAALKDKYQ
jgi:hypothetical protein